MAKMGNKMIALCTAAIGAIYMTGYVVTEPAESEMAQNSVPAMVTSNQQQVQPTSTGNDQTTQPDTTQPTHQPQYRDGTYQGSGTNRFGTVEVAVTIKKGKIADVQITDCSTHYPQSYIDPVLPEEVVQRQSENVDVVSGATRSTQDFVNAVDQALQQALA